MELILVIAIALIVKFIKTALKKAEVKPEGRTENVTYQMPKQTTRRTPVREQIRHRNEEMQQIHAARQEAKRTTILDRAKVNAEEDKADVTLETMEAEHNHSERVTPAKHHHLEDVIPENVLGTVEDLMVKGYDGKLCFERDFVSEGNDMISRFTLGGI